MFTESQLTAAAPHLNVARGPANGPPLLMLHGVTRRWQDFTPLFAALCTRWEVIALDFRGHGGSQRAPGKYRTVDYVRDALALLQSAPEPAVIYGHSLGAMVAAATAAKMPEHVRGVILEDPPWETLGSRIHETSFLSFFVGVQQVIAQGGSVEQLSQLLGDVEVRTPGSNESFRVRDVRDAASLRFAAACLQHVDVEVLAPLVAGQWLEGYEQETILRNLRCPALLLQADYAAGGMLPDLDARRAAHLMPECLHVKVDSAGHLLHWLATETTLRLVLSFLEALK